MYKISQKELDPELKKIIDNAIAALPEMKVQISAMDDPLNFKKGVQLWKTIYKDPSILREIVGAFFKICFTAIHTSVLCWFQPLLFGKTSVVEFETGPKDIYSVVVYFKDTNDNYLWTIENEPGASPVIINNEEKHPKLRPIFQGSMTKIDAVKNGEIQKDLTMAKLLTEMEKTNVKFEDLIWSIGNFHDTTKIVGLTMHTTIETSPEVLAEMARNTGGMIMTKERIKNIKDAWPDLLSHHILLACI